MCTEEYLSLKSQIKKMSKRELKELCSFLLDENQRLGRVIKGEEKGRLDESIYLFLQKHKPN